MKHEERLRRFFSKNKLIGIFASQGKLYEDLALYAACINNLIILFSYSQYFVSEHSKDELTLHY